MSVENNTITEDKQKLKNEQESKEKQKQMTDEEKLYSDKNLTTSTFKCKNCGGEAIFDAKKQKLRCLYCDSLFDIENTGTVQENDINELLNEAKVWDGTEVYRCKNCGAKEIVSNKEVAKTCSFCGTSNIVKTDELPGLKPQGVVPFKMPAEKVGEVAGGWIKHKFYAPRDFKKSAKPENIRAVYNPVFTFDTETKSSYDGVLGEHYTTSDGHGHTTTHTRYFKIKGNINLNFDDFIVQASSNISTATLVKISPFSTNNAPKYTQDFLRGYSASTYTKDGKTCWNEGQLLMKDEIKKRVLSKYSYDVVERFNLNTAFLKQKYKYCLVPVYVGHHTYKGKLYNFYINGENGKITGKTPVSFDLVLMVIAGIVALFTFFGD